MTARSFLLAGVAALLPSAMAAAVTEVPVQAAASRFSPPAAPLVLTRTLYRMLGDGKQLVVTRRYAIRFVPEGDGFRLDGQLLDAKVDAPPMLAGLADLERKRSDSGMFPAQLDARGFIRDGTGIRADAALRQNAVQQANSVFAKSPLAPAASRERSAALGQVAAASGGSAWPAFLFNPGPGDRHESRQVALPDGGVGQVDVLIRVGELMPCGLPRVLERIVTTQLAGTSLTSREVWTLAPSGDAGS